MLSDAKFMQPVYEADEPRIDFKAALRGVGDPMRRAAADFFDGFTGTPLAEGQHVAYQTGDTVEFTTPDGINRVGSLQRPTDNESWLVRIDEGATMTVPQEHLRPSMKTPRHAMRARVQAAMERTSDWVERRQPEVRGDQVILTVDVGSRRISEDEIMAYAAQRNLEALDMAREGNLLRIVASPRDDSMMSESEETKTSTTERGEEPGLHTEEIEGTGMPEGKPVWAKLARAGYKLGAVIDDGDLQTRFFTVPRRYIDEGRVTAVLSEAATPLSGHFELSGDSLRRFVYAAEGTVELPYSSGTGPESTREDYSTGLKDGDYVVKAEDQPEHHTSQRPFEEGAAADDATESASENAGQENASGTDSKAQDYYKDYYGDYGAQLVKSIPLSRRANYNRMFRRYAGRRPTREEARGLLAVLASRDVEGFVRNAQQVPARDIVQTLMGAAANDDALSRKLDRAVIKVLSNDPQKVLRQIDETAYPRALYVALQGPGARGLIRDYRNVMDDKGGLPDPDWGTPEMFDSEEVIARNYLKWKLPNFDDMSSGAQAAEIQDALEDPDAELAARLDRSQRGNNVVLPPERRRRPSEPASVGEEDILESRPAPGPGSASDFDIDVDSNPVFNPPVGDDEDFSPNDTHNPARDEDELPYPEYVEGDRWLGVAPGAEQDYKRAPDDAKPWIDRGTRHDRPAARKAQMNKQKPLGHQVRPKLDQVSSQGKYLCLRLVWDPDECEGMSDGNVRNNIITWVKALATLKEQYPDLGTIGKPRFKTFDPDVGLAELMIRSSTGDQYPIETFEVEGRDNETQA